MDLLQAKFINGFLSIEIVQVRIFNELFELLEFFRVLNAWADHLFDLELVRLVVHDVQLGPNSQEINLLLHEFDGIQILIIILHFFDVVFHLRDCYGILCLSAPKFVKQTSYLLVKTLELAKITLALVDLGSKLLLQLEPLHKLILAILDQWDIIIFVLTFNALVTDSITIRLIHVVYREVLVGATHRQVEWKLNYLLLNAKTWLRCLANVATWLWRLTAALGES